MMQMTKCMNLTIVYHNSIVSFKEYVKNNDLFICLLRNEQKTMESSNDLESLVFWEIKFFFITGKPRAIAE